MKNLGVKETEKYGWCSPEATIGGKKKKKERIYFPSVEFCGSQVETAGLAKAKVGDKLKLTVEVVVRRLNESTREDDSIRQEVCVDIVAAEPAVAAGEADADANGKDDASEEARDKKADKKDEPAAEADREMEKVSPDDAGLDD